MALSRKNRKIQAAIADSLKKGLPLAGLLSSLMITTGCDFVKGIMNRHTVGRIAPPKPPAITTTEQGEEPTVQPSQNQQPDSPNGQNNDADPRPTMGKPAPPCEEKDQEKEKQPRPLMGVPLPPPADKANQ